MRTFPASTSLLLAALLFFALCPVDAGARMLPGKQRISPRVTRARQAATKKTITPSTKNTVCPKPETDPILNSVLHELDYWYFHSRDPRWADVRSRALESTCRKLTDRPVAAVTAIAKEFGDPHTTLLPGDESKMAGIGVGITIWKDELTIASVMPGSPADTAGLRSKDRVISINGTMVWGMNSYAVQQMTLGAVGSDVQLVVIRDGREITARAKRGVFEQPDMEITRNEDVLIIRLPVFDGKASAIFRASVSSGMAARTRGVILDLRGNPGGLLSAIEPVAASFLPVMTPVYRYQDRDKTMETRTILKPVVPTDLPLAVLTDLGTSSASEILAGALREKREAVLIGEHTMGYGVIRQLLPQANGQVLSMLIAKYSLPSGASLDGGLEPTIVVTQPTDGKEDLVMKRAMEWMRAR